MVDIAKLKPGNNLISREKECDLLSNLINSSSSSFVALYGRRRVGKTFLVRNACNNQFDFYLTGIANVNMQHQLANFHAAIQKYSASLIERQPASNWFTAFFQLIEVLEANNSARKI